MRGKLILLLVMSISLIQVRATPSDTLGMDLGELTLSDSLEMKQLYGELEENLDSLVNLWYVENSLAIQPDSTWVAGSDSGFSHLPDSVYIERLSRIPARVNLTYNKFVRNYIRVYLGKRPDLVEVMVGLSEYYFPLFEEIFDYRGILVIQKYFSQ